MMTRVFIGVGSNLGLRETNVSKARLLLRNKTEIRFLRSSQIYETEPVSGPPQGKFLNAVWEIETSLMPRELLKYLQLIEKILGRERIQINGPRTIDLDILFFDDLIMNEPELAIPHPRIQGRWFVLKPLWDLAADFIHPAVGKSVCELLDECSATH